MNIRQRLNVFCKIAGIGIQNILLDFSDLIYVMLLRPRIHCLGHASNDIIHLQLLAKRTEKCLWYWFNLPDAIKIGSQIFISAGDQKI